MKAFTMNPARAGAAAQPRPALEAMRHALEIDALRGPCTHAERANQRGGFYCYPNLSRVRIARHADAVRLESLLFLEQFGPAALVPVAVHEAGHAVVGNALRVAVEFASIIPDAKTQGRVLFLFEEAQRPDLAVAQIGGFAAVNYLSGGASFKGSRSDLSNASANAASEEDGLALAALAARHQVQRHWPDILLVAAALLARSELTGEEVEAVVDRDTLPDAAAWWRGKPAGYWERSAQ